MSLLGEEATSVTAQVVLINLVQVNDLAQTIELDMKIRFVWTDPRYILDLSGIADKLNPIFFKNGIEILPNYRDNTDPLRIWIPDIHFSDAQKIKVIAETLRIRPNGVLFWSRHLSLIISQPAFKYHKFPLDVQKLQIRFESYTLPTYLMTLNFTQPINNAVQVYTTPTGVSSFDQNPLWIHVDTTASINYPDYNYIPGESDNPRVYSQAVITLILKRQTKGIILYYTD